MKEEKKAKNYFEILNEINVSNKTENKNGLTYLSWAWAWAELKKIHPTANYKVYETETGINYWNDGRTAWVKTGVIVDEIEHIEYLPIMDFRNKSIALENITSFDVNKAIQRSLTKAVARHGLGLYIYAGEDLPDDGTKTAEPKTEDKTINIKLHAEFQKWLIDSETDLDELLKHYKVSDSTKLSESQYNEAIAIMKKKVGK